MFKELFIQTDADDFLAGQDHRTRWLRWVDRSYRDVLAVPGARALIGASAASEIGNWLYNAALLGYVYSATRSVSWVGAATICRLLPYVLLGPFGGAVADRYSRRAVLLAGDALRVLVMAALAATVASGGPVALVIVLTAVASAGGCAEKPAALTLLPRLVGDARLGPANALLHTVQDLGVLIGPAIGAILLGVAPAWVAFAANGATFAGSALLISAIRPDEARVGRRTSGIAQLAEGLAALRTTAFARWLIVVVAIVEFTYGAQTVQLVVYATQSLGLGSGGYGLLLTAAGAGGLVSALANGRLSTSRRVSLIVVVAGSLACATQLAYANVQVLAIALPVTVIGTAGLVSCEVVGETALARIVPREALGRVIGVFDAVSVAAMVSGAVLAPVLVAATSLRASLLILGAAALAITLLCHLGLRGLDTLNARRADALASKVKVLQGLPVTMQAPQIILEQLAAAAQFCPLPSGVDVMVQGAPAHAFYAVVAGRVLVRRDGKAVVHLGPGDSFGDRGLLDRAPLNVTVTTETDTTLLRVEGGALLDALEAAPSLRRALDLGGTAPGVLVPAGRDGGGPPALGADVTVGGPTVVVVGAGNESKRRYYQRLAALGARLVIVDEPGHWSESLADEIAGTQWVAAPISGDPDTDAEAILGALKRWGVRPDGILTFWENSVCEVARVAAALGLPGNPPEAVDAARSKVRTRELSARLGLPTPKAQRVCSLDELFAAADDIGFPAVVKPEFGASAAGCVKVDDFEALPGAYKLVRAVVTPEQDEIFRAGSDLLLEQYLDGVEFDVDLILQDGECVFSSVSQNWPTAKPSFQETGLHLPPDHSKKAVAGLVDLSVRTVQAFGFRRGVLHVEGKCTSRGPRVIEVNARMGGTRIHQMVEAVWGVDLIEAQLRSSLDLPQTVKPSRKPRCAAVSSIVYAPATGRLAGLPFAAVTPEGGMGVELDIFGEIGQDVAGSDSTFATALAELTLSGKNLRRARSLAAQVLREPPRILPA